MSFAEIDRLLNKQSGLLGVTGNDDLRDIEARREQGDADAQLALEMVAYRIKKYRRLLRRLRARRCPRLHRRDR